MSKPLISLGFPTHHLALDKGRTNKTAMQGLKSAYCHPATRFRYSQMVQKRAPKTATLQLAVQHILESLRSL